MTDSNETALAALAALVLARAAGSVSLDEFRTRLAELRGRAA